jgi:adenine-specific DNA-methyltransferase
MTKKFNEKLIEILKTDSRFVDDEEELVKAAVIDRAWKIDRDLVKLLLGDPDIKGKFFDEIEKHWIFNINTFIEYISDKNFLANSYTRFRNKIGLNIGGKFLRERGEVSLVRPYKHFLLEGGQNREEEKRKEIFFNEILAQDEIDRLFDPKVLTNWKRYTVDGEQKVAEIKRNENGTIQENLIIKGNNLLALHTLKKQFRSKVKLIYIDPPYNTGNDSFGYNDNFNHSSWLTFMKNRLEAARELLRNDGSIWINIDDDEAHYLKVLCDDVFGRENFVATVIWQHSIQGKGYSGRFSLHHNYIICYSKSHLFELGLIERTEKHNINYKNPDNDPNGPWRAGDIRNALYRPNLIYDLNTPSGKIIKPPENGWRFSKQTMQEKIDKGQIVFKSDESKVTYKIYRNRSRAIIALSLRFNNTVSFFEK